MLGEDGFSNKSNAQTFFENFALHLDHLANQVLRIEHTLFEDLAIDLSGDPNAIQEIQNLDHLRQSLEDLAILTVRLGGPFGNTAMAPNLCKQIARDLKMHNTKALLAFGVPKARSSDGGSLDLF